MVLQLLHAYFKYFYCRSDNQENRLQEIPTIVFPINNKPYYFNFRGFRVRKQKNGPAFFFCRLFRQPGNGRSHWRHN